MTYKQECFIADLASAKGFDEPKYWLNERLGKSRSSNMRKHVSKLQASALIDELKNMPNKI
jgi:hypothetical protein